MSGERASEDLTGRAGPAADQLRPETRAAVEAARCALERARRAPSPGEVSVKSGREVVTATDLTIEDAVRAHLEAVTGLPVVGEERDGQVPSGGAAYWLVDPLCGTGNFASGIPLYCVNLALVEAGEVAAAVVADGGAGEICAAERGRGAWSLGAEGSEPARLAVGRASQTIVLETGRCGPARREQAARCLAAAVRADRWELRAFGTTLALPHVAAGRVAAYLVFYATAVHTAAGSLLASEAGAAVSDLDGNPWTIGSDSIIAAADADLAGELAALAAQPT